MCVDLGRCSSPYGIRTRAATLRGWCPRPLDERAEQRSVTLAGGPADATRRHPAPCSRGSSGDLQDSRRGDAFSGRMATTTTPAEYMLGDAADERARLMAQAALLEDEARALLDRVDIPVGGDVIDIGCGPIGILPLLSERVGPHG